MAENGFDAKKYAAQRTDALNVAAEQNTPFGASIGITKEVVRNLVEKKAESAGSNFEVRHAKRELKATGAGEGIMNLGTWVLDAMQKFYDHRTQVDGDRALAFNKVVMGRVSSELAIVKAKGGREGKREIHKGVAANVDAINPGTGTYQKLGERFAGLVRPWEKVKEGWNKVTEAVFDIRATRLAMKAEKYAKRASGLLEYSNKERGVRVEDTREALKLRSQTLKEMNNKFKTSNKELAAAKKELERLKSKKYNSKEAAKATKEAQAKKNKKAIQAVTRLASEKMAKGIAK